MKKLTTYLLPALIVLSFTNCSTEIISENNNALVANVSTNASFLNDSNATVDVIIYDENGLVSEETVNVKPGDAFNVSQFNEGELTFRIKMQNSDRISVIESTNASKHFVVLNGDLTVSTIKQSI